MAKRGACATSMFLHIGALHLLFNMIVLWQYGWIVERLVGHVAFLAIYLCAGLLGSVTSVLWHPLLVSAGASGAIFGVVGALAGYLVVQRDAVPRAVLSNLSRSTLIFLGFNLYAGLTTAHVDMSAHVGGFIAGPRRRPHRRLGTEHRDRSDGVGSIPRSSSPRPRS